LVNIREEAEAIGPWRWGVFSFLKNIGVVPWEVNYMPTRKVRFSLDPNYIPADYLASAAYEWDTWGESQPLDFVEAIEAEIDPKSRDYVSAFLELLGRTVV